MSQLTHRERLRRGRGKRVNEVIKGRVSPEDRGTFWGEAVL